MRTFETRQEQQAEVERNIRAHRRIHRSYERRHSEIFNALEQARLRESLQRAVAAIGTGTTSSHRALDFGCGTGNLTGHLVELDLEVVAADVSPEFLLRVGRRFRDRPVETMRLNGIDLDGTPDGSFDLVAAYSVLHHVPNYLDIVEEMQRVLRPGGILYLDHEANELFWEDDPCLVALRKEVRRRALTSQEWWNPERKRWQRFLVPSNYIARLRTAVDPDWWWKIEGDIHTWPGDHIEWDAIVERLRPLGGEVVFSEDYLLYRAEYPLDLYENYRTTCSDMRVVALRKAESV